MPAIAAVTLTNAATSNIAFNPQGTNSAGVTRWADGKAAYDAKHSLTQQLTLPSGKSSVARLKQKLSIPVMDSVWTTKKVAETIVTIEFVFPKLASQTDRLDAKAYAASLLAHANTVAAVTNLENVY